MGALTNGRTDSIKCIISLLRYAVNKYCDVPGSPCLSKTGIVVGPSFSIFGSYRFRPPVNGPKDPWPVSCRCPEPRWFVGNPTSLARDNIYGQVTSKSQYLYFVKAFLFIMSEHVLCKVSLSRKTFFTSRALKRLDSKVQLLVVFKISVCAK